LIPTNRIRTSLAERGLAYGTWAQMGSPEFCELAALSGLDFVIVDMEHSSFGIETAVNMIRAVQYGGASAMVRAPDATPSTILKILDAGAAALMVPNVSSGAMTQAIVSASRHAPRGTRSACPCTRASGHGIMAWQDHVAACEADVQIAVLIETADGIANFDDIIAVPGIDIVALGPFDLSQAMGYAGDWTHPAVQGRLEQLVRRALDPGLDVMPSIFDTEPEALAGQIARWRSLGARIFAIGGDRFMLSAGYRSLQQELPR
jgi:4-hydroxy-2-oxoheptanedioate aldolase